MWEGPSCPHSAEAGGGGPGLYGQLKESAGWERQCLHPPGQWGRLASPVVRETSEPEAGPQESWARG